MTKLNENAMRHLLANAKTSTKAKTADYKVINTAKDGDYEIEDIRIISIAYSIEYKTWTVEISVKKDDEASHKMRKFKLTVDQSQIPMWQKVQMDMVQEDKAVFDFSNQEEEDEPIEGTAKPVNSPFSSPSL